MAKVLTQRWAEAGAPPGLLPDEATCEVLLDTMYQASLLCEESEAVRCRLVVADPEDFAPYIDGGDRQLQVLRFAAPFECTPQEVRKLSAAASYYRAMLGVGRSVDRPLRVWGLICTGTRWVNRIEGGRFYGSNLPPNLVVQILGAGHLIAASGYRRVLESAAGQLLLEGFDPFLSKWLPHRFRTVRAALQPPPSDPPRPQISDSFVKDMAQSFVRRVLSLVRNRGHGGLLVYMPEELSDGEELDRWFRLRVQFAQDSSTLRFQQLMQRLIQRVQIIASVNDMTMVTWNDYQRMEDAELAQLDETLIAFSHFVADLMNVDGAVVLDRSFRLIGFGGEILGDSPVHFIHRALDLEAIESVCEPTDSGGTRHRSAYRLISGVHDAIAVVVSQDGSIRFVGFHQNKLTYWPYLP